MAGSGDSGLYSSATGGQITRPAIAEFVGTFLLVFVGCSVAVAAALERPLAGPPYNSLAIALAFGLALVAVVAAIGHISGGHVNPAVTIGQAAVGLFPWRHVPVYVIAQLAGAIAAALAVWLCFGDAARDQAALGATALAQDVSVSCEACSRRRSSPSSSFSWSASWRAIRASRAPASPASPWA